MGTVDNFFFTVPDRDLRTAFANESGGDGQLPRYRFGVVGYGSAGGMVGCGGAAMRRLFGPYSTFAGVHGTARDFTGVAGTSINHVGVYGQVEENTFVPRVLHAGVLGAGGFAKVIKRGDYHVFLTPRGDCRGLYVRSQGGASFEVRELGGGTSSVAFSYRIVGRRKDITRHKRFAKIDMRLPLPAVRGRRPTLRAFIAEIEKEASAKATPAMRKSDREVAALPPPEDVPF
jgi:hypothetical protein